MCQHCKEKEDFEVCLEEKPLSLSFFFFLKVLAIPVKMLQLANVKYSIQYKEYTDKA